MSFRFATAIFAAILFLNHPAGKKDQLLKISKKYFPENYVVLKEYDDDAINHLAEGNSLDDYISDIPTVVHEGYHTYVNSHSSYFDSLIVFRINDTLSFYVSRIKTFPSRQISAIVPDSIKKKVFRYDTYIDEKEDYLVTQQFGILGLLEEASAYYQSYHTSIALYKHNVDHYGWKKPGPWLDYLGYVASFRYAITEFELFISWYLQYAKTKYPSIYKDIINNKGLKKMISFLHNENARLGALYDSNRKEILKNFSGKLVVSGNFILNMDENNGKGLYDDEVKEMNALLARPEHNEFRKLLQ